jgi:curved DNA-binding protein
MSAPPAGKNSVINAGKFNDHYAILGVDASAETDMIERAYARMVEKYGPDNIDTRDDEKFVVIKLAYETLSDPDLRKEFDTLKGNSGDRGRPMFTGVDFFDLLGRGLGLRAALLCVLYDRRRGKPFTPALSMRHIESIVDAPLEAMSFALWYLKQRGYITNDDKSNLQITVDGMDFLEANRPSAEYVMPFIKPSAIAGKGKAEVSHAPNGLTGTAASFGQSQH